MLELELLSALASTESDFRTASSLAEELACTEAEVAEHLDSHPAVRRPLGAEGEELSWYRLKNRGLTGREKYRYFLLVASRGGR